MNDPKGTVSLRHVVACVAASLAACGGDPAPSLPGADAAVSDIAPATDVAPATTDATQPPPTDGASPAPDVVTPAPDVVTPAPDVVTPAPDVAVPPRDVPAATDASCGNVGAPTTATPMPTTSATSNFNVQPNACTRTALALQCELGVAHSVQITVEGNVRRIRANGVPNHDVGAFPNPGNPNAISAQVYNYAVPVTPSGAGAQAQVFGIALSGVVLDPGTAEVWNNSTNWRYEAMRYATAPSYFSGTGATDTTRHPTSLGVDCNFAHVQPNGAYHYHGIPNGMLPATPALTFVGWAGDGYPIFGRWDFESTTSGNGSLREMRASYRLRTGTRPSGTAGPGGAYDGTFVQDWEYAAGLGDLDECNGRTSAVVLEGRVVTTYHYVLTNTYPYIPRCFHATPDASFARGMMMPMGDAGVMPMGDAGMTGPRACTNATECTGACAPGARGCTCATTPMGMRCVPTCTSSTDCGPGPMGMTLMCRAGVCLP
jgi:YHYH protein